MIGPPMLAWAFDPWTYALVALVALLLFGKRLPEVGRSLGKGIAEFKKGLHDVQDEMMKEDQKPEPPKQRLQAPAKPPAEALPDQPAPDAGAGQDGDQQQHTP